MPDDLACGYLVSRYPSVTHTFVLREVRALRALGVRVEPATVRRVPDDQVLGAEARAEQARTHALLPVGAGRLLAVHARAFIRSPRAYLGTLTRALRLAHAGGRARLWQLFYFAEAILLHEWLESERLHHVHVHHANVSADVAMLACAFANATGTHPRWTWSLTVHGPTELYDVAAHKLAEKAADAAAVVCISDFARSQVAAFVAPEALRKLHTVRCGIDVTAFRPREAREPSPGRGGEVLCVAALSRRKGIDILLRSIARLAEARPEIRLTLVGDGPERDVLERVAADLGITGSVTFAGAVGEDRIREYYARAHAFCLPSFAEGVPVVLMEAMAMQLAVVTTNVMGTPELVEHEVSGLLVPPARADLLAAALERVLADPALARRLARAGRDRVERDYEIGRAATQLREVFAPVLTKD